jgi:tyrocidine synthetase-3
MELIKKLKDLGVVLMVQDGKLDIQAPKGIITPDILQEIKEHKSQIIAFIESYKVKKQNHSSIQVVPLQEDYAVSSSQKRLWVLSQQDEANVAYNITSAVVIEGQLDVISLKKAFYTLLDRHEILRTTFKTTQEGEVRQVVNTSIDESFFEVVTSPIGMEDQIRNFEKVKLNLEKSQLFQAKLYSQNDHHILVMVMHHIISDGWSMQVLTAEVMRLYAAFSSGQDDPLQPMRIQYKDFANWQQNMIGSETIKSHKKFWMESLSGELPVLELETDKTRPALKSYNGALYRSKLDDSATNLLNQFEKEYASTLFTNLLAIVNVLLYKLSSQKDLIVGSPTAGRVHEELENQIGFYVNTLALRTQIEDDKGFDALLDQVKMTTLQAQEHQLYPFDELVDELKLQRDMSRSPLFDVMVVLQNIHLGTTAEHIVDIKIKPYQETSHTISKYDLTFLFTEENDGIYLNIEYNTDLFLNETIKGYSEYFQRLCNRLLTAPKQPLSSVSLLTPEETDKIVFEFNNPNISYPNKTIIQLFEEQVEHYPSRVAVKSNSQELTYSELNAKANQLGRYLIENYSIENEDFVGLLLDRNTDILVCIIATLKIGAAYVPIDPSYPESRIDYMKNDSQCKVLITEQELALFEQRQSTYSEVNLNIDILPGNLAYVIYTSGTTGLPKGVLIEHKNVVRLLFTGKSQFDFNENDVWTLFHSYCFDFSVWEMYGALLHGGKLVVVDRETTKDPESFVRLLKQEKVTVLNQTPSAFYNVIKEVNRSNAELHVRYVIFGGEALAPAQLKVWYARYPETRLINMYGITETTVHVTYKEIGPEEIESNVSNIGKAIPTTSCYVLDENLNLLPPGVVGELYVGGEGVARGYLNRSELTGERFLDAPFLPGTRIYKSGDKVRLLDNGEMEYLGRLDDQVKIRGHRIELAEIETFVLKFDMIYEVVVIAKKDETGKQFLVAYFTSQKELTTNQLYNFLRRQVPEYMIPSYFVQLEQFPLTHNGKIDKKKLPDPRTESILTSEKYSAPETDLQKELAAIYQEIFGERKIGIDDNFFALGGDSITAINFATISKNKYGKNISVNDLYEYQTIAGLEQFLRMGSKENITEIEHQSGLLQIEEIRKLIIAEDRLVNRLPESLETIYPLTAIEQGMIFSSLMRPEEPVYYDQFTYSVKLSKEEIFKESVQKLCDRHAILRTKYFMHSFSQPIKTVLKKCNAPLSIKDISELNKEKQEKILIKYAHDDLTRRSSFDDELLWHLQAFKVTNQEYILYLSFHHSVLDGWSVSRIITELGLIVDGLEEQLPQLDYTYVDYCAIMLGRKKSEKVESFWIDKMRGYSRNKLPFNYKGTRISKELGMRTIERSISQELRGRIERLSEEHQLSFKAICLAAHVYLMKIICSEGDVVTGVVTHERPELENSDKILGCFLNTIPIRVDFQNIKTIRQLLNYVSDYLIEVKPNEVHLSEIAKFINDRTTADNPIFDSILNFTDFHSLKEMKEVTGLMSGEIEYNTEVVASAEMTNTKFDVEVDKTLGSFSIRIKFLPAYFDASEISTALELYVQILEQFTGELDLPLDVSELISREYLDYFLNDFNGTIKPYSENNTVHSLFEEAVVSYPQNVALRQDGAFMTYEELNSRSNQVAQVLVDSGIRPGDNVGIIVARSFDMIIGLMGILKSGGAYVPVDPEYPLDRQAYILSNSNVKAIVVDKAYDAIQEFSVDTIISMNEITWAVEPIGNLGIEIPSVQLVYTIYTSGSTGRPKGVMIAHRSAVNLIEWVNKTFNVDENDRLLFITSMCFDLSVYDIFGTLASGGSIVIAKQEQIQNISELKRLLTFERITFWDSVPTTMNYLIGELEAEADAFIQSDLRVVFMSGDWIPVKLPNRISKFFPNAKRISLGGATEGTVWSNAFTIDDVPEIWTSIPYGRPIANNFFYILDENGNMLPKGVAGELYIGGVGVAEGYANDEAKTAYSYVKDSFIPQLGGRMYRTGDLGRLLPSGNMEFLGRVDHQVKIRGFRVELGEIESVLQKHQGITEAVVNNFKDAQGNMQLCAYLVLPAEINYSEITHYLKDHLPSYMIPNYFVKLDALPLTSNGKINRKALPEPSSQGIENHGFVAPENELEKMVTEAIASILSVDKVGMTDDFFESGANSLQVGALINRLHKKTNVLLEVREVFEDPTAEGIVRVIQARDQKKFELIPTVEVKENYPISDAQRRLWILSQFSDGNVAYNLPSYLELHKEINVEIFENSVLATIERHEILRTVFREDDEGEIRQWVIPVDEYQFKVHHHDFKEMSQREIDAFIETESLRPFDLENGPLIQASLLQLSDDRFIFFYNLHHIISDGWSMEILSRDVMAFYQHFKFQEELMLPELRIQYKDYTIWKQTQIYEYESGKAYWLNHLAGSLPILELPLAKKRPPVKTYNGKMVGTYLSESSSVFLKQYADNNGGTLFMSIITSLNILFYRYTGNEDIIFGSPIAGRDHEDLTDQIGFYVNTLALRTQLNGSDSFAEIFENVKNVCLNAYAHQAYPFDSLVEEIGLRRDTSRSPIFDVFVSLQEAVQMNTKSDVQHEFFEGIEYLKGHSSIYDLVFNFERIGSRILIKTNFNTDVYTDESIHTFLNHFKNLLDQLIKDERKSIDILNIMNSSEYVNVLTGFNDTHVDFRDKQTVLELFQEQVRKAPHAKAILFGDVQLNFAEFDKITTALAVYLRQEFDLKTEDIVGIEMERSEWMVIAIWGILKAGGVYAPIDPNYPEDRKKYIKEDTGCKVCLTQLQLEEIDLSKYIDLPLDVEVEGNNLAYVIYTSGTTGEPKGVLNEHGALLNRLLWMKSDLNINADDVILQKTPFTFDVSVWEFILPFISGSTLIVARPEGHKDPVYLRELINEEGVTLLHFVPSMLEHFLLERGVAECTSIRNIVCSGEALSRKLVNKFQEVFKQVRLFNYYGPTEAAIDVTSMELTNDKGEAVSIGRPVANTQIYILNDAMNLQFLGSVGEICIGGVQVSRGYLNKPELTDQKFVNNPYNRGKLYRTGDLGFWNEDGTIAYLGRKDDQVKIRGHRIELGEIEAALVTKPELIQASVLTSEDKDGHTILIAYIVSSVPEKAASLYGFLSGILPMYMIPSRFVQLEKMPLTTNGKLDRKALKNMEGSIDFSENYVEPRNEIERTLVEIWNEALEKDKIGVKDNFFALGGHSLIAIRLIGKYHKELGVKIELKEFFDKTSIAEHAELIRNSERTQYAGIEKAPVAESYPLSSGQRRLWILSQFKDGNIAHNMPTQISISKKVNVAQFEKALLTVIERHEILRTVYRLDESNEPRQWILSTEQLGFKLDYQDYRELENPWQDMSEYINRDAYKPFNLEEGPLIRASLIQLQEEKFILYYNLHHIISDGWSMKILSNDVLHYYDAFSNNMEPVLQELNIQYKDYTVYQLRQFRSGQFDKQVEYWKSVLLGDLPILDLPSGHKRPLVKTYSGERMKIVLSKQLISDLKAKCNFLDGSLFNGFVTLWNILFYRYTGNEDIIIGTPVAGREHPDLSKQIGFYVNTVPLRNHIVPTDSFEVMFDKIKKRTLEAFSHQNYPFDQLVEIMQLPRNISRSPIFDVMLTMQDPVKSKTEFPEDKLGVVKSCGTCIPKFDLDIYVEEINGYVSIDVDYNVNVYESHLIKRLLEHFQELLCSVLDQPQIPVSKLNLLYEEERKEILGDFNNTATCYAKDTCIIELFEEQLIRSRDQIALVSDNHGLTYAELNDLAEKYAAFLHFERNIFKGDRILVQLDHNQNLIAMLLAIKKLGAVYIPLDVDVPEERAAFIFKDSGAKLKLGLTDIETITAYKPEAVICRTEPFKEVLEAIIYTSGSTGTPKGVRINSKGVINRFNWMWTEYPFSENEICCVKTSISFVDHIWEIFGPLLKGVPLVIYKKNEVLAIPEFIDSLHRNKVSRIVLVPSLLKAILSYPDLVYEKLQWLKLWICSGEMLNVREVDKFYHTLRSSDVKLLNIYGSTEVTADATCYDTSVESNPFKTFDLFEESLKIETESMIREFDSAEKIVNKPFSELNETMHFSEVIEQPTHNREEYLKFLRHELVPNVVNVGTSKYIGHMTGPVPKIFRDLSSLVTVLNQNQVKIETSMISTLIEKQVIGTFHSLVYRRDRNFYNEHIQNPEGALGIITNGGTISNITALSYALNQSFGARGEFKGITKEGLVRALNEYGFERVALLGSSWCHYSCGKALKTLGLGTEAFVELNFEGKSDEEIKVHILSTTEKLRKENTFVLGVIGVAGTTESGNIEPLKSIGEAASAAGIYYHVDAAFGGSFLMDLELADKFDGIELADSVSVCAHKQMYVPIGLSICLFKKIDFVLNSENNTYYQARKGSFDLGKYTLEGSRNFATLLIHAGLCMFGRKGFGEVVRHNYKTAQWFAQRIQKHEAFELMYEPQLNIVLYRYIPIQLRDKKVFTAPEIDRINDLNTRLQKEQFTCGNSFVSITEIARKGETHRSVMLRTVIMNPVTSKLDMESILDEQLIIGATLEGVEISQYREQIKNGNVPVGKPIGNVKVYILDSDMNILPKGVVGEICISGDCVSDGYVNENTTNQGRFVTNPFDSEVRLYKTGDLGYWTEDGNIELKGRIDDQVKIRGHRIELGDIENCLKRNKLIREAVAVIEENNEREISIAVYFTSTEEIRTSDLRSYMASQLPEYMIPSYFIALESFPLTPTGKINKGKLPPLKDIELSSEAEYMPPSNEIQRKLVSVWEEVLKRDNIGIQDNFFDLGGDSIKSIQIVSKLKQLGYSIRTEDILRNAILEQQSKLVKEENTLIDQEQDINHKVVGVEANSPSTLTFKGLNQQEFELLNSTNNLENVYKLSPLQEGVYYHWLTEKSSSTYFEQFSYRLRMNAFDINEIKEAYDLLVHRYPILRTAFTNDYAGESLQVVYKVVPSTFSHEEMPSKANQQEYIDEIKVRDRTAGFDLKTPTQMRLKVLILTDGSYEFIWSFNHILMDGWCMSILINDFYLMLDAIRRNEKAQLPEPALYSDYIEWLDKIDKRESLDYWKEYLKNYTTLASVPFKKARSAEGEYAVAKVSLNISGETHKNIRELCSRIRVTHNTFIQSVWGYLLSRYNSKEDVVFGSVVSGRPGDLRGVEQMVGLFINTIPVRVKYNPESSPLDLLKDVQEKAISTTPYHYLNLSEVQSESELGRSLMDHFLVFENFPVQELVRKGVENRSVDQADELMEMESMEVFEQTNYDFSITIFPGHSEMEIRFEFNEYLYDTDSIRKVAIHLQRMIDEFINKKEAPLKSLNYLSEQEEQEFLEMRNTQRELEISRRYWLNEFADHIPTLHLPMDFEKSETKVFGHDSIRTEISSKEFDDFRVKMKENHSSFDIGIRAAVIVVLAKYSGQTDLVIGDLFNANQINTNILPIRTRLELGDSIEVFVEKVSQTVLYGRKHQVFSTDSIIKELEQESGSERSQLYNVAVIFGDPERLEVAPPLDLSFHFTEIGNSLGIQLHYNANLFRKETVTAMVENLKIVIKQMSADTSVSVREVSLKRPEVKGEYVEIRNDLNI